MTSKKIATHTSTETRHEKEATMSTPTSKKSHAHHETTTPAKETTVMSTSIEAASVTPTVHPSTAAAASPVAGGGATTPTSASGASVEPPPTSANIPVPPAGFTPAASGEFRTVVPRKAELAALPQALIDLSKFGDFDKMFAGVGLTQVDVLQCLQMGSLWSTMRGSTSLWDQYCVLQEGYAWRAVRAALLRLEQAFLLAAQANPKLVTMYPGLSSLLGAKKSIAQKAASTRRLNKEAKANGEPETHGVVGKKRQRRAEKAALANAAAAPAIQGAAAAPAAPVAQGAPPAPVVAVPAAGLAPVNGVSNGVGH